VPPCKDADAPEELAVLAGAVPVFLEDVQYVTCVEVLRVDDQSGKYVARTII
jgi:hypothetical protein